MTSNWSLVKKTNKIAVSLADDHYSRQKIGSREIGPPGQKIVLLNHDHTAVWGSHRPAPWAGIERLDKFSGSSCFIFRNTGDTLSSILIREAVGITALRWGDDPFITYVALNRIRSSNPGFCFLKAGFDRVGYNSKTKLGLMARLEMSSIEVIKCRNEITDPEYWTNVLPDGRVPLPIMSG